MQTYFACLPTAGTASLGARLVSQPAKCDRRPRDRASTPPGSGIARQLPRVGDSASTRRSGSWRARLPTRGRDSGLQRPQDHSPWPFHVVAQPQMARNCGHDRVLVGPERRDCRGPAPRPAPSPVRGFVSPRRRPVLVPQPDAETECDTTRSTSHPRPSARHGCRTARPGRRRSPGSDRHS